MNTLPSSVNSLAAQCGTCSIMFFASSSSPTEEVAAPVAFVFLAPPLLFVLSFLLVKLLLLLLLLVIANEDDDGDEAEEEEEEAEAEEAEHFGIRLLLVVAVIVRRGGAQRTVVVGTEVVISISFMLLTLNFFSFLYRALVDGVDLIDRIRCKPHASSNKGVTYRALLCLSELEYCVLLCLRKHAPREMKIFFLCLGLSCVNSHTTSHIKKKIIARKKF